MHLCKAHPLGDGVCLVQYDLVLVAVEDVLPQNPREVVIHIGVDVVEFADEGVFDPVSNRLGGWVKGLKGQMKGQVQG